MSFAMEVNTTTINGLECARLIVKISSQLKGNKPVILEVSELTYYADYFVIISGDNSLHTKAIAQEVLHRLAEKKRHPHHVEGLDDARWILIDYNEVICHIFVEEWREFYALEYLWGDAPRLDIWDDQNTNTKG